MIGQADTIGILNYLSEAGVVVFFIVVVWAGYKRKWVFGWQYDEKVEENKLLREERNKERDNADAWKEAALSGTRAAQRGTTIAQEALRRAGG